MNLHGRIMNIPAKPYDGTDAYTHYCRGHRDARHAAAELAISADKLADAMRDIAKKDPVEMALDPQWAQRIAKIVLTECGYDA